MLTGLPEGGGEGAGPRADVKALHNVAPDPGGTRVETADGEQSAPTPRRGQEPAPRAAVGIVSPDAARSRLFRATQSPSTAGKRVAERSFTRHGLAGLKPEESSGQCQHPRRRPT